ncbi:ABC transporter permease [Clostridium estertheticum]|uniref:ABC transporter permease n=1 Tax=Clostridium estertheticum TaxID=238834 RepID=UPI0013E95237|nr:ABC transporter permease [Clostridium estertheticum]MBZ9686002.1 ABC transporter permease [Clostridium estertheticum]
MLQMVLRKMIKNRWMVLCLLIGVIIATAMMSSIPEYTGGILQKVLTKDLEDYQVKNNVFPGTYYLKHDFYSDDVNVRKSKYDEFNNIIKDDFYKTINIPALYKVNILNFEYLNTEFMSEYLNKKVTENIMIKAMSDMDKHIKMLHGHHPSKSKSGDVYEVMISETAMHDLDLKLDSTYNIKKINTIDDNFKPINVKIAGVFAPESTNDTYWYQGKASYSDSLFMDYSLFCNEFMKSNDCKVSSAEWYAAFDYHKITLSNISDITTNLDNQYKWLNSNQAKDINIPSLDTLKKYDGRQKQLKTLLWVLQVPVILMLIFYLFMVSQLIMEEEKNEIAVLKSRGATRVQIFKSYLTESLILSGIAIIFGPLIGMWICKLLGASNGFLNFVQRTSLPIYLDYNAYLYALIAIGLFILTMLIPAFFASKTTIVLYKQEKSKINKKAIWQKYFIDFVFIGISSYGIYNYNVRQNIMNYNTGSVTDLPIDPLLFLISTFFILGVGLLFLRIYPHIIKLVFWIGKKTWSPTAYASLLSVSRSTGKNQFLILFLIFTLSIGIFNAKAARTINTNNEEKIKYSIGADVTIMANWINGERPRPMPGAPITDYVVTYTEPDYKQYESLSGVAYATKVYTKNDASITMGDKDSRNVCFMGIIPSEFGKTAWFRTDLLTYHWYNYLNLMTKDPRAFLLSRSFQKKYNIKLGDEVTVTLGERGSLSGIAYAFVDYWPTYNPHQVKDENLQQDLIVGNFNYVEANLPIAPYEVWIKKQNNVTSQQLYDDIKKKNLKVNNLKDTSQEIIKSKNDPILQGINGALTLGFLVTMAITAVGFLIYWIISIRSRILQFGVLRAMGFTFKELIKMLIWEQFLISVTAIFMGVIIGGVVSDIFVPMLKVAFNTSEQIPPFKVIAYGGDYIKIYATIGIILLAGLIIIGRFVSKIKINEAIKLGED